MIYPYTAGQNARLRYQLRRARVLAHSLLAWALALPLVILQVRPLPHLSAATPITQIQPPAHPRRTRRPGRVTSSRHGWGTAPHSTPGP